MKSCKLVIQDEVNIKIEGLPVDVRRKISNKMKYEIPYAKHMPQYKLGRWDGKKGFFGIGGSGYLNHLDQIITELEKNNYTIGEIVDHRQKHDLSITEINQDFWGDTCWPSGHPAEGEPIKLRDYQVEVINNFIKSPQSLQEVATGAGKTIITATLSKICESFGRTLVIVPNKSLVTQTEEDYLNCGLDVGVYFGERKETGRTHTICTWQSLNSLDKKSKDLMEPASIRLLKDSDNITLSEFLEGVNTVIIDECFSGNTLITTPHGKVPIKDLKPGDKVINLCEKTKQYKEDTVVKVHKNLTHSESEGMLELEFDNGVKTQVTANHKFLTNKGWIRADELTDDLEIVDINTYS